jgi:hypothetical protein
MMGSMQIDIKIISKVGVRVNTEVTVKHAMGPGEETTYTFPLIVTSNLLHDWNIEGNNTEEELKPLIAEMYDGSIGLSWSAPQYGYWFDQHNAEATMRDTVGKMRNDGRTWFLQNPAEEDRISAIYGGAILTELERSDEHIAQRVGMHLLDEPDRAFEADFISKASILCVIIDNFGVHRASEAKLRDKLQALENWLVDRYGQDEAQRLLEPFRSVRGLRNQYPLHDRYKGVSKDKVLERDRVKSAAKFFGFQERDNYTAKWKRVCDRFRQAVQELEDAILK